MAISNNTGKHGNRPQDWKELILATRIQSFACSCEGIIEGSNDTFFKLQPGESILKALDWATFLRDLLACNPVAKKEWVFMPQDNEMLAEKALLFILKGDPENSRYLGLILKCASVDLESASDPSSDSQGSILIADDQEMYRTVFARILEPAGYTCFQAGNGKEAIGLIEQNEIDLILLDLKMPVMDGLETLRHIRAQWPEKPVFAITANEDLIKLDQDDNYEFDQVISKPPVRASLLESVKFALHPPESDGNHQLEWVNLEYLHNIAGGNDDLIKELIGIFLETVPDTLDRMQTLSENEDWAEVKNQAHKVKANFKYLGMLGLFEIADELERIASTTKEKNKIGGMIQTLSETTAHASIELKEVLKGMV